MELKEILEKNYNQKETRKRVEIQEKKGGGDGGGGVEIEKYIQKRNNERKIDENFKKTRK